MKSAKRAKQFTMVDARPTRTGTIGLLLLGAGLLSAGCGKQNEAGFSMPPPLVTVTQAVAKDVPVYLDEIGTCTAMESVTVRPQVSGVITQRHFEDGAELKKGQLLFTIDPRPFQAQLDAARAQLAQSKAAVSLADIQLKMYSAVSDVRAVSKSDFDTKKNAVDVANAQVQSAQAAIETAQLNLDYCSIHSPIDGRAGQRLVDAGNVVQMNTTPLLLIQRLDPIYADFTITERELPEVQREMAGGRLRTLVRLPIDPESAARSGDLTFLDNQVQSGTGTVRLRATIPNPDHHFWPGQFLDVRLILSTDKGAILVPNQATQISQQGPYVYVIKPDRTADLRLVTLGQRQGDDVVVSKGVAAGENVVVTGQLNVRPGGPVRFDSPAPGGEAAGAEGAAAATEGGKS